MNEPNEKRILSSLEGYSPEPSQRFYQRMANAPWNAKQPSRAPFPLRRVAVSAVLVLVVFLALGFSIPTVRASFIQFINLRFSPSETVPNPPIQVKSLVDSPKIDEISQLADWPVLTPNWLPKGYTFHDAVYDSTHQMVLLTFFATRQLPGGDPTMTMTETITVVQAKRNDMIPLMVAPSTVVEEITINGAPAAYATGAWESDGAAGTATWTNNYPLKNIYWQVSDVFLNLNTKDNQVSKEDLVKLAESMR
jgi:hypothetical protein